MARSAAPTGWVDYDENQARIYAFADPEPFRRNRDAIAKIVQGALGVTRLDSEAVDISEPSAWLTFRAPGEWMARAHPALPAREEALRIAREALVKLERACSAASDSWRDTVGDVSLLPPVGGLNQAALAAVPRPDGTTYDHWLYRLAPTLTLDGKGRSAVVLGAQVEVRIGDGGRVISLSSRWHPISGATKYVPLVPFVAQPADGDEEAPDPTTVQYVLDGDDAQQYYLAPYHARVEDHALALYSASLMSLTVDIGRVRQSRSSMTLVAMTEGGSGDYAYHWGAFSELGLGGFVDLSRGTTPSDNRAASQIELPNGAYVVALNVLDRATGAFKHHRQLIAASAIASSDDQGLVA